MNPVYIANLSTVAIIEGCTKGNASILLTKLRKEMGKRPKSVVSLYEYCKWKKTDYHMLMIDMKAGILRPQFLKVEYITKLEQCTDRTAFNRMTGIRKLHNFDTNDSILIRHYADFISLPIEFVYSAQQRANT
jgi:hypothetical protein